MITDLPQDFLDEINKKSRKPIQLLEFLLPEETFYLSDKNVGTLEGLEHQYSPWVESWGTLKDNTFINNLYSGDSLEIRSGTITLVVSSVSRTFVKKLFQAGIENTKVNLYQWFEGCTSPPFLIDTLVCQDPISHSEASMLLSIDLVSPLMKANPYLFPQEVGYETQPVVVGKANGMPLKDLQTARKTTLEEDITFNQTGQIFIGNGIGFAASGFVTIDSEKIAYSSITASSLVISARGQGGTTARPHIRGALVLPFGGVYDYVICAGPVQSISNLKGNGETYQNSVEFFPGQNPVIARFVGRPPWLKVAPGAGGPPIVPDPVSVYEFGASFESYYGNTASPPISGGVINTSDGYAALVINQNLSGGAGNFSKYGLFSNGNNLGVNDYTRIIGSFSTPAGPTYLAGRCGPPPWGSLTNGRIGSIDHKYGQDDSAYGDLTGTDLTVTFQGGNQIILCDMIFRIIFVSSGGEATTLKEWTVSALNTPWPGITPPWNSQTYHFHPNVSNFADLQNSKIRFEVENIVAQPYSSGVQQDRIVININPVSWGIFYYTHLVTFPSPYQQLVSHFNRNLSAYGSLLSVSVKVKYSLTVNNSQTNLKIVRSLINNITGNATLWSTTTSSDIAENEATFDLNITDWNELLNTRVGIFQQIIGPNTEGITRRSVVSFRWVRWFITYQPASVATPDEERVVYAEDVVCDVTSLMGENPTPPTVLRYLIENNSDSGQYIDTEDFDSANSLYSNASYYLNGVIEAGTRLHDAIKKVLSEGMCRFLFNQGKIKLITFFEEEDETIDFVVDKDDIQLRSRRVENQPTDLISNDVTVMYDQDYLLNVFNGKIDRTDQSSIVKFSRKDLRKELTLVSEETTATTVANRLLSILSKPKSIYSFNMFMKAFQLEKGDRVSVKTFLDERFSSVGQILSIERIFGQGKNRAINLFKLSIANPKSIADLYLIDVIKVNDNFISIQKGVIIPPETILIDDSDYSITKEFRLSERMFITDNFYMDLGDNQGYGYGVMGYGLMPYGDLVFI